ncbi:hypothetical protein WA026_022847 [Henosepilachna vigintioctopunctata]|uniref:Uncharacterized protein n=1 Tax=Henosepilachna vigintioctopunctata TaxID=420089 RepID=A0AAW1V3W8_9CUCU
MLTHRKEKIKKAEYENYWFKKEQKIEFDNEEINCLTLGYKYRPHLNNRKDKIRSLERLAAETDTIIQSVDNPGHIKSECERVIRNQFAFIKNNKNVGHFNKKIIVSIKDKIKRNNLVLT